MSLESLTALKSLVQVREQGASVQNDNLENVQQKVQQIGTSEAKRFDDLNLEKAKAIYEQALTAARVERLQSQLIRESKAVENAKLITGITIGLSAVTNIGFAISDIQGKNKLNDQTDGGSNGGTLSGGKKDFKNGSIISDNVEGSSASRQISASTVDKDGNQALAFVSFNGSGAVGGNERDQGRTAGVSFINTSDVQKKLVEGGFFDDKTGKVTQKGLDAGLQAKESGRFSFEDLYKVDKGAARSLLEEKSRDVQRNEVGAFLDATSGDRVHKIGNVDETRANIASTDRQKSIAGKVKDGILGSSVEDSLRDRITDQLEATGVKDKFGENLLGGAKSIANAVVTTVSDVQPFYQAYLKMKDKRDQTADELQAEIKKLAAAKKKIDQLTYAIENAGAGGDGSAGGAGQVAGVR